MKKSSISLVIREMQIKITMTARLVIHAYNSSTWEAEEERP
jgi:hypothetical protein